MGAAKPHRSPISFLQPLTATVSQLASNLCNSSFSCNLQECGETHVTDIKKLNWWGHNCPLTLSYFHNYNECPFKRVSSNFVTDWCNCEKNVESDFCKKNLFICRSFEGWIEGAEKKIVEGYPSPNNMEEATTMVNNCKVTKLTTDDSILGNRQSQ